MSYEPHPNDRKVAATLDGLIGEIMSGNVQALGVCGVNGQGEPIYFFFDKTPAERETLLPVVNKMLSLYATRRMFIGNAPENNRSHGTH